MYFKQTINANHELEAACFTLLTAILTWMPEGNSHMGENVAYWRPITRWWHLITNPRKM